MRTIWLHFKNITKYCVKAGRVILLINILFGSCSSVVEQWIENPCVSGSIPLLDNFLIKCYGFF